MIFPMEMEEKLLINKDYMKDSFIKEWNMVKEYWSFLMEQFIRDILERIILKDMEFLGIKDFNMMVTGERVWNMAREFILFRMEVNMRESIMMIKNMVRVFIIQIQERLLKESGSRENWSR